METAIYSELHKWDIFDLLIGSTYKFSTFLS